MLGTSLQEVDLIVGSHTSQGKNDTQEQLHAPMLGLGKCLFGYMMSAAGWVGDKDFHALFLVMTRLLVHA